MAKNPKASKGKPTESPSARERREDSVTGDLAIGETKRDRGQDLSGMRLSDFLMLRKLGSGGMGEVYLGQQVSLKRQVAIKVLRSDLTADETALRRFAIEAEAAAKLTHTNIVQIYAFERQGGISYMALEYVQGMNLRDFVAKKGPTNARLAVKVMEQVAAALHHASEAGIVHRDIKPDNILLTRKGEVKVADFGLARLRVGKAVNLTQTGVTMGTPLYMSPEQIEGKSVDTRSDLYSFGVTCYYMLTGQAPFRGETALAVAVQHIKGEVVPIEQFRKDLPPELCRIVHKLMAKDPDQRYQTGRQLLRDLQKLRGELSQAEKEGKAEETLKAKASDPVSPTPKSESALRRFFGLDSMRRHVVWWFAATVVLGLGGGAGVGWNKRSPELRPRPGEGPPPEPPVAWQVVPQQETAKAQYEYALVVGQHENAEAAWLAVVNHPDYSPDWARRAQMQLGKHYLDEHQLAEAEKHFNEMAASPDPALHLAGEVGKAAVLSLRDNPKESLEALWAVVKDGGIGSDRILLGMVFWTFERNYRNMSIEWEPEVRAWANRRLEELRGPQSGPRPGPDRPGPPPPGRSPDSQRNPAGG